MCSNKLWTRIDQSDAGLHPDLYSTPCFYYLIHTDEGFIVPSNQKIINFKIKPEELERNPSRKYWKNLAIAEFSQAVSHWLKSNSHAIEVWENVALIPMPTSRPRSHQYYDTRLVQLCNGALEDNGIARVEDVFDLTQALTPAHEGGPRDFETLRNNLVLFEPTSPLKVVILIDDILTSGSHFSACSSALREAFPEIAIIGLFLARHKYV